MKKDDSSKFFETIKYRDIEKIRKFSRILSLVFCFMMFIVAVFGSFNNTFDISKATNSVRFSNPLNWINLLFLGVVANGICFTAWNKACQIVGTGRTDTY